MELGPRKSRKSMLLELQQHKNADWNTRKKRCSFIFAQSWRFVMSVIAPMLLMPIFLWKPSAKKHEQAPFGLYITALMAIFWVTECVPMAITGLLPVILLPLFGIASSEEVCPLYFNNVIIFLFGGCTVALAFEYSNLHTRIALFVMKSLGAKTSVLLFGMMYTCMFLSCWMNNTSTSAMMVPVIFSVMEQYRKKLIPEETPAQLAAKFGNPEADDPTFPVTKRSSSKPKVESSLEINSEESTGDHSAANENEETEPPREAEPPRETELPEDPKPPRGSIDKTIGMTEDELEEAILYWEEDIANRQKYLRSVEVMLLLGVAASSNIGGTGVITGTGTNLIAVAQLKTFQDNIINGKQRVRNETECLNPLNLYWELDFVRWIVLNFLPMVVSNFIAWCFLAVYFEGLPHKVAQFIKRKVFRRRPSLGEEQRAKEKAAVSASITTAIIEKYKQLGKTTLHEWIVIFAFLILVVLWILKNPLFFRGDLVPYDKEKDPLSQSTVKLIHPACLSPTANLKLESNWGWGRFFGDKCDEGYVHDYVPTVFICVLLFCLPKDAIFYKHIFRGGLDVGLNHPVLPLEFVARNTPWGPLFMLGGGFGIAMAIDKSGFGNFLQEKMKESEQLKSMDQYSLMALILSLVAVFTTIASNTAVAVILAPVLLGLSATVNVPPLYMLVAPIVAASYSFILPISTPPNAIVYDKGNMKQMDMMLPGLFLTVLCNLNIFVFNLSWIHFMLDVGKYDGSCSVPLNVTDTHSARQSLSSAGKQMSFFDGIDDYSLLDGMNLLD